MLSRDLREISKTHNASAVVVGTYAEGGDRLYVSARMVRPTDNIVISAYDYGIPMAPKTTAIMLRGANTYRQQVTQQQAASPQALQCEDVSLRAVCPTTATGDGRFRTSCQDGSALEVSINRVGQVVVEFIPPISTGYIQIQATPSVSQAKRCLLTAAW